MNDSPHLPPSLNEPLALTAEVPYERHPVPSVIQWPADDLIRIPHIAEDPGATSLVGVSSYQGKRVVAQRWHRFRQSVLYAVLLVALVVGYIHIPTPWKDRAISTITRTIHNPFSHTPVTTAPKLSVRSPVVGVAHPNTAFTPAPLAPKSVPRVAASSQAPAIPTLAAAPANSTPLSAVPAPIAAYAAVHCIGGSSYTTDCAWYITQNPVGPLSISVAPAISTRYIMTVETPSGMVISQDTTTGSITLTVESTSPSLYVIISPTSLPTRTVFHINAGSSASTSAPQVLP